MTVWCREIANTTLVVCFASVVCGLIGAGDVAAQQTTRPIQLRLHFAAMKPFAFNDRWYVTAEGYHVHPACEDFTPGLNVELALPLNRNIEAAVAVLAGIAPAYLGMIDQNSATEFHGREGMGFLAVTLSPSLVVPAGKRWSLYLGPVVGYGWLREVEADPTFGPTVVFGGSGQALFGGRVGLSRNPVNSRFSFSAELISLSKNMDMEEQGLQQQLSKFFGPFGILIGISYSLN